MSALSEWFASASATDNCGNLASFSNDAPSSFPIGTTLVTWMATDSSGNQSQCSSSVTVTDTSKP